MTCELIFINNFIFVEKKIMIYNMVPNTYNHLSPQALEALNTLE